MKGFGDIVNMPLPTEWAPEVQYFGFQPFQGAYGQPYPVTYGRQANQYGPMPGQPVQQAQQVSPGYPGVPGLMIPPVISGPAGGNWNAPMLPDSVLPRPLQRTNPLLVREPVNRTPGRWDLKMLEEARWWTWVRNHGGLKSCCRIPSLGAPIYDYPPWQVMPSNARKLEQGFAKTAPTDFPNPYDGTDTLLGTFQVPLGWDGVITRFVPNFVGTGFTDFSGSILWRLKVANRFAPDLGNVNSTYGSLTAGFSVPGINNIRIISGQTVYCYASIPTGSAVTAGTVSAIVFGWFYPRR